MKQFWEFSIISSSKGKKRKKSFNIKNLAISIPWLIMANGNSHNCSPGFWHFSLPLPDSPTGRPALLSLLFHQVGSITRASSNK